MTCGSEACSPGSAGSISASSAPACASSGTARSSRSHRPSLPSTGHTSPITATFDLFAETPWSPSTSCAAGSPARTSASPAAAQASTGRAAAYGASTPDLFESCDPVGSWLKTSLLSELEAMTGSRMTWKRQATPSGRSWWVLTTLARPTDESASGLLPTPTRSDANSSGAAGYSTESGRHSGTTLTDVIVRGLGRPATIPTPSANDWKGSSKPGQRRGQLTDPAMNVIPRGCHLSPRLSNWMMGFPLDWCDIGDQPLPRSATRSCQRLQSASDGRSSKSRQSDE